MYHEATTAPIKGGTTRCKIHFQGGATRRTAPIQGAPRDKTRLEGVARSDVFEFLRHFAGRLVEILGDGFLLGQIDRVVLLA